MPGNRDPMLGEVERVRSCNQAFWAEGDDKAGVGKSQRGAARWVKWYLLGGLGRAKLPGFRW